MKRKSPEEHRLAEQAPQYGRSKIVVSGATGFIGNRVCHYLGEQGFTVARLLRKSSSLREHDYQYDLNITEPSPEWFEGATCLIHGAARVHMTGKAGNDYAAFHKANVRATVKLVQQAVACEVPQVIFLSSVAVYGLDSSQAAIGVDAAPAPKTAYGLSKLQAEDEIRRLCQGTATAFTIIRVPLVFGPNAPGNFGSLVGLALSGYPLLFPRGGNRRTMVHVDNLAHFIASNARHRPRSSTTLLFTDGNTFSTEELVTRLRVKAGIRPRLSHVPGPLLKAAFATIGKRRLYRQLFEDLVFDPSEEIAASGWRPVVDMDAAFADIARR